MSKETYAEKIAKLLRKAESTTPEEAELLYQKAQELMAKYSIDEAMVAAASGTSARNDDPIVKEEFVCVGIYRHALVELTFHVLHNNGIKVVQAHGSPWRQVNGKVYKETRVLYAVGYKSDIDRARALEISLHLQAMRAENQWWSEHQGLYGHVTSGEKHRARRGFLFGFSTGAGVKLAEATSRGRKLADEEHGSDSVALVLRDKSLMVQDEFTKLFPDLRSVKDRKSRGDSFARSKGYEKGKTADVGQPGISGRRKALNTGK